MTFVQGDIVSVTINGNRHTAVFVGTKIRKADDATLYRLVVMHEFRVWWHPGKDADGIYADVWQQVLVAEHHVTEKLRDATEAEMVRATTLLLLRNSPGDL